MFSQEYGFNIKTCDGCACRCMLGAKQINEPDGKLFYPMIDGRVVDHWIDKNGEEKFCMLGLSYSEAVATARNIAKNCDGYKTGFIPVSGSVRCAMCSLPAKDKCDLCWCPVVDKQDRYEAWLSGAQYASIPGAKPGLSNDSVFHGAKPADALNQLRLFIGQNCVNANKPR